MSFSVYFWKGFNKQLNSTRQPDNGERYNYNCILKDGCSVTRPVIRIIDVSAAENLGNYNYAQITVFNRYYYVRDTKWVDRAWEMELVCDVLATYKNVITSTTMYITRTSVINITNDSLIDTRYLPEGNPYFAQTFSVRDDWNINPESNGVFVVGIVNSDATTPGGISYYVMDGTTLASLRAYMMGNIPTSWNDIATYSGEVARAFIDPFQYITSCMWFPFQMPTGDTKRIKFGFWESDLVAPILNFYTMTISGSLDRPARNDTVRGVWMYQEPFAQYWFFNSIFGMVPIAGQDIDSLGINYFVTIDFTTGSALLKLQSKKAIAPSYSTNSGIIYDSVAQLGVSFQLSQITNEGAASLTSIKDIVSTGIQALLGGAATGDLASGAIGATTAMGGTVGGNGSLAAMASSGNTFLLIAEYYHPQTEDLTEQGRPACVRTIPNQTGNYYEIWDGNINMPGTDEEKQQVKSYLEGGFHVE